MESNAVECEFLTFAGAATEVLAVATEGRLGLFFSPLPF